MDIQRIHAALQGDMDLNDLTVVERMAFAHEILRAELIRPPAERTPAVRFTVPEAIERLYRGASS